MRNYFGARYGGTGLVAAGYVRRGFIRPRGPLAEAGPFSIINAAWPKHYAAADNNAG